MRQYRGKGKLTNDDLNEMGIEHENGWVKGHLIEDRYIVGDVVEFTENYFNTEFWVEVDPKTVGQYTTKNDKHGAEIYGNEYVKVDNGIGFIAKVVWSECSWMLQPHGQGGAHIRLSDYHSADLEIVDNPELLGEGTE